MEFQIASPGSYEVAYECSICNKVFNNLLALENHQRFTHCVKKQAENNNSPNEAMRDLSVFYLIQLKKRHDFPDFNVYFLDQNRLGFDVKKIYLVVQGDDKKTTTMNLEGLIQKGTIPSKAPVSNISGPFKCTWMSLNLGMECGEIFLNCCEYSVHHRDKHTKRRKNTGALRCQVCEKVLENPNAQSPAVEFPCHLCGQVFMNALQLEAHTKGYHTKVKPFKCSICEKRFTQSGGLQQHMRMHTGARPYKCNFCNKGFTQKGGLDQHLRTHTKVKPFKCIICNKSFSQSVHVRQHMRTHTNIQPFKCIVCERRFKQISHLNFHMRSHEMNNISDSADLLNSIEPIQSDSMYYSGRLSPSMFFNTKPNQ
ncbi:zinc finger protein 37 isoform X1 [Pieris rapae]|uniref:zinc finger protein 37 isoform X1 n=1 Tax=Pieris rapae TaxID=64459 RepID=UPI001E27E6CB|nr:zinc finger protein 37 isoform X1 [Pieris rapae]